MSNTPPKPGSWWLKIIVFFAAMFGAYFINLAIQSHRGEEARANTGLHPLTLTEALAKAQDADKLALVELSAVWCPNCRALDRKVLSDPIVHTAIDRDYVFALVDWESKEGEELRERWEIHELPTLLVLRPDGSLLTRLDHGFDPAVALESLTNAKAG